MHSGDCWARTEMVRVSPGVEERNSSSFQRNVIIDNLPIVLTFRHSIEESSGQSRFHVFLLLLLLLVFFFLGGGGGIYWLFIKLKNVPITGGRLTNRRAYKRQFTVLNATNFESLLRY